MLEAPKRPEIDHRTIKLVVGVIATSLAWLTNHFASSPLTSVSAAYYEAGWSQTIFIGFLFAIAAFLLAYNGTSRPEMLMSKVAAAAALGVALFPCGCGSHPDLLPADKLARYVHGASAAAMFLILAYFCLGFCRRARDKRHAQALARATIYALCGMALVLAILAMGYDHVSGALTSVTPRFTFYGETTGLVAFGISWLTASRVLPIVTREDERFSPLRESNPD